MFFYYFALRIDEIRFIVRKQGLMALIHESTMRVGEFILSGKFQYKEEPFATLFGAKARSRGHVTACGRKISIIF